MAAQEVTHLRQSPAQKESIFTEQWDSQATTVTSTQQLGALGSLPAMLQMCP